MFFFRLTLLYLRELLQQNIGNLETRIVKFVNYENAVIRKREYLEDVRNPKNCSTLSIQTFNAFTINCSFNITILQIEFTYRRRYAVKQIVSNMPHIFGKYVNVYEMKNVDPRRFNQSLL